MKKLLFITLFWMLAGELMAQVVTPSLDPALPARLSSAISWRYGSTIGVEKVNQQKPDHPDGVSSEDLRTGALIAYQPSHTTFEVYNVSSESGYNWEPSTDSFEAVKNSLSRINVAVRGENRFSIGIGFNTGAVETGTSKVESKSYGGSFSVRVLQGIFLGGGIEKVTETPAEFVTLKYDILYSGLAFMIGDPTGFMFRVEGSVSSSPETKTQTGDLSIHHKTQEANAAAEILMGWFLLSYLNQQKTLFSYDSDNNDKKDNIGRYGVGFRGDNLSIVAYKHEGSQSIGSYERVVKQYQVTLGFSFF